MGDYETTVWSMQVPREIQDIMAKGSYGIDHLYQQPSVETQSQLSCGKSLELKSLGKNVYGIAVLFANLEIYPGF